MGSQKVFLLVQVRVGEIEIGGFFLEKLFILLPDMTKAILGPTSLSESNNPSAIEMRGI